MNFDTAFTKLLNNEGGLSNNSSDPGGLTKYGISQRAFPFVDIPSLTLDQAKQLYRSRYWLPLQCDKLPDDVRFDVFDAGVNSGVMQAVKWLQEAVQVEQDGVFGPITLAACQVLPGYVIHARMNGIRLQFMTNLSTWGVFSKGWARRIASNLQEV
jgi:lysozyme family protein